MGRHKGTIPQELSAKTPVSTNIEIFKPKKRITRDPRFVLDDNEKPPSMLKFAEEYKFLVEKQEMEIDELKTKIKQCQDPEELEELKRKKQTISQRLTMIKKKSNEEKAKLQHLQENSDRVMSGKNPKFVSRKDLKGEIDEMTYGSKLKNVIEKRRKREDGKLLKRQPRLRDNFD
ncbi:hypothetical protein EIN_409530 [Entamoeba invadens IP1]|uniref:rRNA biogenesis protein RRP36 n=1 Tax=Entamoeba invadens IP1 TaxID=370355 RepID=A0A0A1TWN3_ENTIV|nr:hypothetical protein EIN_409530 [Entamoeba invadens IP1]ELP85644.1 hypothetical protein EIN_409530 [Entamoeba invadens IP1]|eukprot:XP_004184990.1 hypothetical protein EIN_409530 [Entamoeba invadens IP1]